MKEFDFIEKYLRPLTQNFEGALNLLDDTAIIQKDATSDYVITKDGIAENTHFLSTATPEQIAEKLLAINISDLAAKGAKPLFYLSFGSINKRTDADWLKRFTAKTFEVQKKYNLILLGGDTVKTNGNLFYSVTMLGEVVKGKALLRSTAKAGDDIYVSGTIGDAEIGLKILRDNLKTENDDFYISRHYQPTPRVELGQGLIGIANSSTDCSDGVFASVNNICIASNLAAEIDLNSIPFSDSSFLKNSKDIESDKLFLASAGDDYELVFTASPDKASQAQELSKKNGLNISKIGKVVDKKDNNDNSKNLTIIGLNGSVLNVTKFGFEHS